MTLAKDLISLDDISGGWLTLGVGAGGTGFGATALGQVTWPPRERTARFEEFLELLDRQPGEGPGPFAPASRCAGDAARGAARRDVYPQSPPPA